MIWLNSDSVLCDVVLLFILRVFFADIYNLINEYIII